jgi:hypothetical protein
MIKRRILAKTVAAVALAASTAGVVGAFSTGPAGAVTRCEIIRDVMADSQYMSDAYWAEGDRVQAAYWSRQWLIAESNYTKLKCGG